jgi:hypothetical protein
MGPMGAQCAVTRTDKVWQRSLLSLRHSRIDAWLLVAGLFHAEIAEVRRARKEGFRALRARGGWHVATGRNFEVEGLIHISFPEHSADLCDLCVK